MTNKFRQTRQRTNNLREEIDCCRSDIMYLSLTLLSVLSFFSPFILLHKKVRVGVGVEAWIAKTKQKTKGKKKRTGKIVVSRPTKETGMSELHIE